ncbi:MAG: hypothetical protein DWQ35_16030 [Planctomycetota bacterium]|nr:MAG: hypothetical protein DWQ35_16030 [Planctomycetota bacterium]REK18259.1 MAG: hypothetical protein DWQ42_20485 [Planctomycetota bacterium]REK49129.1 MAG: hypothetical protein DWQ46_01085 [Planctomycetota bacterium]
MGRRNRRSKPRNQNRVRIDGKTYNVIDRQRLRGRIYLVLRTLSPTPRARYLVCDPAAGMQLRMLLVLPDEEPTAQHASVLRNLNSRSLPQIFDIDRNNGRTRIVLSWTPGIDLGQYLQRIERGKVLPPTPAHAVRLVHGMAVDLTLMHRYARIIHGDLKPANLIISRKPSRLSLIDFGSAWPIERTGIRHPGDGLSPVYAAPEQQHDAAAGVDERADQFAASVLLYQLLTLKTPFEGLGGQAGLPRYFDPDNVVVPPSEIAVHERFVPRRLRRQLDDVVQKGLALDPGQRFLTSGAWLDALRAVHRQLEDRDSGSHRRQGYWEQFCDWLAQRFVGTHQLPPEDTHVR